MLKLYPLFSGSSGNMYLIESEKTNIIIDVGVSYKKCKNALASIGKSFENVSAIFITHEHTDHIRGLSQIIKRENIPVYSSNLTCEYILESLKNTNISNFNINPIDKNCSTAIMDITVNPFDISHDALEPFGYKINSNGSTIAIATDLGIMTNHVMDNLHAADFVVIESNYDKNTLDAGSYPFMIKKRIDSSNGHLSNEESTSAILELAKAGKRNFLLAHLSENNNLPVLAHSTLESSLLIEGFNIADFNINLAGKEFSKEVYVV